MNIYQDKDTLQTALYFLNELKLPVFPVGRDKKPKVISWKKYVDQRPSEEEITNWFTNPENNIALPTGISTGIAVIDIDANKETGQLTHSAINLIKDLRETWHSITGGSGHHYFYKITKSIATQIRIIDGVDIKADGGYIILPPSIHASGNRYTFDLAPWDIELAEFPYELFSDLIISNGKKNPIGNNSIVLIPEGKRNEELTSIAGTLFKNIAYKPELCKSALLAVNEKYCSPPLSDREVLAIAESVSKYHEIKSTYNFNPITISELIKKQFPSINWAIRGLIPKNSITVVSGNPASYKTFLECTWARDTASGSNFVDRFETSKVGVLFIDEENGAELLQKRFQLIGVTENLPIYVLPLSGFSLNEETVLDIVNFCKKTNIEVVFIDSLIRIHNADENSAKDMAKVFKHLKELVKNSLTVICTHHNRKQGFLTNNPSQSMRGSSDILASVDCHLAVERNEKENKLIIRQTKLRQDLEIKPFQLNVVADEMSFKFEYAGELEESKTLLEEAKEAVLELLKAEKREMFKKEIQDLLRQNGFSAGKNTVNKAIDELEEEGYLSKRKGEGNKAFFGVVNYE